MILTPAAREDASADSSDEARGRNALVCEARQAMILSPRRSGTLRVGLYSGIQACLFKDRLGCGNILSVHQKPCGV